MGEDTVVLVPEDLKVADIYELQTFLSDISQFEGRWYWICKKFGAGLDAEEITYENADVLGGLVQWLEERPTDHIYVSDIMEKIEELQRLIRILSCWSVVLVGEYKKGVIEKWRKKNYITVEEWLRRNVQLVGVDLAVLRTRRTLKQR